MLAALNAAGYDADASSPSNSPLRAAVKKAVLEKNPKSLSALKLFFQEHKRDSAAADFSQYLSYALSVDGPPSFKPRYGPESMPPDAAKLADDLSPLMESFCNEADCNSLWDRSQPAFDKWIEQLHQPVTEAIMQCNVYLRNPTSGVKGRRFQIYVDLLAAPNQVQVRSFNDDYFMVLTASPDLRIDQIRHGYLHYLLDPLVLRNALFLEKKRGLGDLAEAAPALPAIYKEDFTLLAGMSLVKAVEARLDLNSGSETVSQAMAEGYVLTAYFFEALAKYEKQEQSLRFYLPEMIKAIDLHKEDVRISAIKFVDKAAVKTVKTVTSAPAPPSPAEASLNQAEELYKRRDLEGAKAAFQQILSQSLPAPQHAKAWFGLARIAALEKQPEMAQQFFEKTLASSPDDFEKAWSYVYLARLARASRDPETARKQYQAALAVPGASEGVRKAVEQEMATLASTPNP